MTDRTQAGTKTPNAIGILLVVCVALFFGVLNASAVAVVLPDIAEDLSVDTGQLSWLMTGFLLIYGIAIPFYGRLADRYGARRLFLTEADSWAPGRIRGSRGRICPRRSRVAVQAAAERAEPAQPERLVNRNCVANCAVPWMPECEEVATRHAAEAAGMQATVQRSP